MRTTSSTPAEQITAAAARVEQATAALEQTVRDLVDDHTITITAAASALGSVSRVRVQRIMADTPPAPTRPVRVPMVYLRGAGQDQRAWERIETAMWARGWDTTHDRTTAWHAARSGLPVALVDFSAPELDRDAMTIARVRARVDPDEPMDLPIVLGGRVERPMIETPGSRVHDGDAIARLVHPLISATLR